MIKDIMNFREIREHLGATKHDFRRVQAKLYHYTARLLGMKVGRVRFVRGASGYMIPGKLVRNFEEWLIFERPITARLCKNLDFTEGEANGKEK